MTFIITKGNICLEEFLMLLMDRNFNTFAMSNKQAHIISGNLPELRYGELLRFFSHISEPLTLTSVLLSLKRASNYIIDKQYFLAW